MPSWAATSAAPRSSRRRDSDVLLPALPRGGQIKCFQAYHSSRSTSAPLNWRRGRGGVIRVVILRTPERREIRWISTANAPLSPIVGQSELRRVASSHDTHLENHIIMEAAEGSSCDRHKSRRCTFPHKTHPKRATSTTKSKSSSAQIAPQSGRPKPSQACHSQACRAPSAHHPHHGNCKRAPVKLSAPQARTISTPRPPGPATDVRGSSRQLPTCSRESFCAPSAHHPHTEAARPSHRRTWLLTADM